VTGSGRPPRLSAKEQRIIELLVHEGELYGLQIVALSRGELKRGTVYVTLARMEEKGYILSRQADAPSGGLPRRLYVATALGRRVLSAWTAMWRRLAPEFAR
jgi:PadR family transcriptional regulator